MFKSAGFGVGVGAVLLLGLWWAARRVAAPGGALVSAAQAVNPLNPDNVFSSGADAAVQAMTGDASQTLGGWVFDTLNPRAGLAPNEYSPGRGLIVSRPIKNEAVSNAYASALARASAG